MSELATYSEFERAVLEAFWKGPQVITDGVGARCAQTVLWVATGLIETLSRPRIATILGEIYMAEEEGIAQLAIDAKQVFRTAESVEDALLDVIFEVCCQRLLQDEAVAEEDRVRRSLE